MDQENNNQSQTPAKSGSNAPTNQSNQLVLAYGSNQHSQFNKQSGEASDSHKHVDLTNHFASLSRQIYSIVCGNLHTVVLTTNGEVYTFGNNEDGALGRSGDAKTPGKVELDQPIDMISAGESHTIACNSNNSAVYYWGAYKNTSKTNIGQADTPQRIGEDDFKKKKIQKVVSGANHTLALVDGKIFAWGDAEVGILGRMPTSRRKNDQGLKVESMGVRGAVEDIFSAANHAFLRKTEKKKGETHSAIFGWGLNDNGQLGIGTTENTHLPSELKGLQGKNIKNITGGEHHTVVLTEEGEVYCFGKNDDGQVGVGKDYVEPEEEQPEGVAAAAVDQTPVKKKAPPKNAKKGKKGKSSKKPTAAEEAEEENQEKGENNKESQDAGTQEAAKEEGAQEGDKPEETEVATTKEEGTAEKGKPRSGVKRKGTQEQAGEPEEEKAPVKNIPLPKKLELTDVQSIYSGNNCNYAVTSNNDVYSWGVGKDRILGTDSEETVYVPTKLTNVFPADKVVFRVGLGDQHVVVLLGGKDDKEPELEEEVLKKNEETPRLSRKNTGVSTGKKGSTARKGKGAKEEEEGENDTEVKKDLSKSLEDKEKKEEKMNEETNEEEEDTQDKGQKKAQKRKAKEGEEATEEADLKKVKKTPPKEQAQEGTETKPQNEASTEKMDEEKDEQKETQAEQPNKAEETSAMNVENDSKEEKPASNEEEKPKEATEVEKPAEQANNTEIQLTAQNEQKPDVGQHPEKIQEEAPEQQNQGEIAQKAEPEEADAGNAQGEQPSSNAQGGEGANQAQGEAGVQGQLEPEKQEQKEGEVSKQENEQADAGEENKQGEKKKEEENKAEQGVEQAKGDGQ